METNEECDVSSTYDGKLKLLEENPPSSHPEGKGKTDTKSPVQPQKDLHPIFHKDPADYMQYIYKNVSVKASNGTIHTGRLYTIDPVSESIVLVTFIEGKASHVKIISGHAIGDLTVLDDDVDTYREKMDGLFRVTMHADEQSPLQLAKQKNLLKSWLLKNRLPIEESPERSGVLVLADVLFIEPPYTAENCLSTNEIILGRVQGLIKNMPKDVEDW